ncbi:MAG: CotH kinase family protein [Promethearchaeota archaeon]
MASLNSFKNKEPKNKLKVNSLTFLIICSLVITSIIVLSPLQTYPNNPSDLPALYISCGNKIEKKKYVNCILNIDHEPTSGKIRIRGVSNADRDKVGYRIELSEQISLLGMRTDDDWQLFAMYQDMTRMKYKLSFDLWNEMQSKNSHTVLPESRFVNLFINGKFQGLYLLAENDDRKLFGLDKEAQDNSDSSLIFQAKRDIYFTDYDYDDWEQDWPNEDEGIYIIDDILPDLIAFVDDTNNETFFDSNKGIYSKFDKDNLIDFLLFGFFNLHRDAWNKNFFLIRNTAPNKFYLIPWDFDYSWGQFQDRFYEVDKNPEGYIQYYNKLFERLMNNLDFMYDCKIRWFELREDIFVEDYILGMLSDMYEEIEDSIEVDLKLWNSDVNLEKYVDYLFEWIPERLEFCDSYFTEF